MQPETFWSYLAGLIDGDGCIEAHTRLNKTGKGVDRRVRICVAMTDLDVVEDIHIRVGLGSVYPDRSSKHKTMWRWSVGSREDVEAVLMEILPYLRPRKKAQAIYTLHQIQHWREIAQLRPSKKKVKEA